MAREVKKKDQDNTAGTGDSEKPALRVVIVSPHSVGSRDSGDRVRTATLLEQLPSFGVEARLVTAEVGPARGLKTYNRKAAYIAWRTTLGVTRTVYPFSIFQLPGVRSRIREALDEIEPDVIDFQHSFMWQPTRFPALTTFHNVESFASTRSHTPLQRRAVMAMERRVLRNCDRVVVFSEDDVQRLKKLAVRPPAIVDLIPIGHGRAGAGPVTVRPQMTTAAFVGSFDYAPNLEAARWLIANWRRIQETTSLRELLLIGRRANAYDLTAPPGVEVLSDVPDVSKVLARADLAITPLTRGAGVRVKIIEALSMRIPVLTTAVGCEGLGLVDQIHARIVEHVADLPAAAAGMSLADDRQRLVDNGYQLWRSQYSAETMAGKVADAYRNAIESRGAKLQTSRPSWPKASRDPSDRETI